MLCSKNLKIWCVILSFCFLWSCSNENSSTSRQEAKKWMEPNGKVKVLSTIAMINDLVQFVGDDLIDTQVLIKGSLDPHSYQLVKGDDEKLAAAEIIFYNGLGLEHGPSLQHYLQSHQNGIPLGDLVSEKEPDQILKIQGQYDPHIWLDVSLWAKTIPFIVAALSKQDPSHAEVYKKNGETLQKELQAVHQEIYETLHAVPQSKRYLVTSHDAFNYFAKAYLAEENETKMEQWQPRFAAPEGLAPESQLSATNIQQIIDHLRRYHITVLFPESNVNKDSIRKIVDAGEKEGLSLKMADVSLYADAMGKEGSDGDTYVKMVKHDANTIADYLKHQ